MFEEETSEADRVIEASQRALLPHAATLLSALPQGTRRRMAHHPNSARTSEMLIPDFGWLWDVVAFPYRLARHVRSPLQLLVATPLFGRIYMATPHALFTARCYECIWTLLDQPVPARRAMLALSEATLSIRSIISSRHNHVRSALGPDGLRTTNPGVRGALVPHSYFAERISDFALMEPADAHIVWLTIVKLLHEKRIALDDIQTEVDGFNIHLTLPRHEPSRAASAT